MYQPICLYSIAKRQNPAPPAPGVLYNPLVIPEVLIAQVPPHGVGCFGWDCAPVDSYEDAIYIVHPSTMPPPAGFRFFAGNQPTADIDYWVDCAYAISEALYVPPAPPALPPQTPAVPQCAPVAPRSVTQEPDEVEDQVRLVETAGGYALVSAKERRTMPASNYIILEVSFLHRVFADERKNQTCVRLVLHIISATVNTATIEIPMDSIDSVSTRIGKGIPTAITYTSTKTIFGGLLAVLVRERLVACPHRYTYRCSGWVRPPQSGWVYVHDGATPPCDFVRFESGFSFGIYGNGHATPCLVKNAWRLLSLSKSPDAALVPFLFAHLGLIWSLFDAAGYPPHVLLFIKGTTGSLKTAVASLLFNFTADPEKNIPATFRDTSASMEVRMGEFKDRVLLVDDFCPAASENARRALEQNLEQIVRFYGDGIAKARTNPKLEETYDNRPHGLCVITGEDSAGSYSSLLRCLFLTVQPNSYDKQLLAEFQKNPALWTEYLKQFVDFCAQNADEIISHVKERFPELRERAATVIAERRLVDAHACLSLAAEIALAFAAPHLEMLESERAAVTTQFDGVILETCRRSAEESKEVNPVQVFARAIFTGIDKGTLHLAERQPFEANPGGFSGFADGKYWIFWPDELFDFVRRTYELGGKKFLLSKARLWEALYQANALVPPIPRGTGGQRFEYLYRVGFGNRPRMLRINPTTLKEFL